ncbi:hypothetical protein GCM10007301_44840 [Azorhizobium oxalatiphilum]|uniref:HTH lysR-type domain-containing protein n=1 Tax=Azorhizobium oxalatiphilum TaxID=980631 RepID=A0A917C9T8_9HYPH|nr:hypothetical protein GCM10007301_44840 [Azorhizobium oxalatiphilum]
MTITLAQLRYFCELADAGTFGRAAARLHMSQPPLSRQIAALEAELKTELCVRGAKGIVLTPAGVQFLADARDVLRQMARARRNVAAARAGEMGQLSIGFTMCAAYSVVPALMRRYRDAFPQVQLKVREMMPVVLDQALRSG